MQHSQQTIDQLVSILKKKDKKIFVDTSDKIAVQKALEKITHFETQQSFDLNTILAQHEMPNFCELFLPPDLTNEERKICYDKLLILETDLTGLREVVKDLHASPLQLCFPSSEAPFSISILNETIFQTFPKLQDVYKLYLRIQRSEQENEFPETTFLSNDNDWLFSPYLDGQKIKFEYAFQMQCPLILSQYTYHLLTNIKDVRLNLLHTFSYFQFLSNKIQATIIHNISAPSTENIQQYAVAEDSDTQGYLIDGFSFVHPSSALDVICLLREQMALNFLLELIFQRRESTMPSSMKNILKIDISLVDNKIHLENANFCFYISAQSGTFQLSPENSNANKEIDFERRLTDVLTRTLSIPVIVDLMMNEQQNELSSIKKKEKIDIIDPYHEFLLDDKKNDLFSKIGRSWLSVNLKFFMNEQKNRKIWPSKSETIVRRKFIVEEEDDDMSLLKSMKNIDVVKELISPPPPPQFSLHRQNFANLLRGIAIGGQSSSTRPDTTLPMLNNAFSDLEAIAEIGAADESQSEISEQSSKSLLHDTSSPNGGGSQNLSAYQGQIRLAGSTPIPIQMSPIDPSKSIFKRRLMQQQTSSANMSSSLEVFDFVAEEGALRQQPILKMPQFNDANMFGNKMSSIEKGSPLPYQSPTGRGRRGRGRRAGNMGDRQPSSDFSPDSTIFSPDLVPTPGNGRKKRGGGTPTQRGLRKPRISKSHTQVPAPHLTPSPSFVFSPQFPPPNVIQQQQQQQFSTVSTHQIIPPRITNFINATQIQQVQSTTPSTTIEEVRVPQTTMGVYDGNFFEDSDEDGSSLIIVLPLLIKNFFECDPPPPPKMQAIQPKIEEEKDVKISKIEPEQGSSQQTLQQQQQKSSIVVENVGPEKAYNKPSLSGQSSSSSGATNTSTPAQSPYIMPTNQSITDNSCIKVEVKTIDKKVSGSMVVPYSSTGSSSPSSNSTTMSDGKPQQLLEVKQVKIEHCNQSQKALKQQSISSSAEVTAKLLLKSTEVSHDLYNAEDNGGGNTKASMITTENISQKKEAKKMTPKESKLKKSIESASFASSGKPSAMAKKETTSSSLPLDSKTEEPLRVRLKLSRIEKGSSQSNKQSSSSSSPSSTTSSQSTFEPASIITPTLRLSSSAAPPTKQRLPPSIAHAKQTQKRAAAHDPKLENSSSKRSKVTTDSASKSTPASKQPTKTLPVPAERATSEAVSSILMSNSLLKSGYKIPKFREQEPPTHQQQTSKEASNTGVRQFGGGGGHSSHQRKESSGFSTGGKQSGPSASGGGGGYSPGRFGSGVERGGQPYSSHHFSHGFKQTGSQQRPPYQQHSSRSDNSRRFQGPAVINDSRSYRNRPTTPFFGGGSQQQGGGRDKASAHSHQQQQQNNPYPPWFPGSQQQQNLGSGGNRYSAQYSAHHQQHQFSGGPSQTSHQQQQSSSNPSQKVPQPAAEEHPDNSPPECGLSIIDEGE